MTRPKALAETASDNDRASRPKWWGQRAFLKREIKLLAPIIALRSAPRAATGDNG